MGSFFKTCNCARPTKCPHDYTIRYRDASGTQREESGYANQDKAKNRLIALYNEKRTTPADVIDQRRELGQQTFKEFADDWFKAQRHLVDGSKRVVKPSLEIWLIPRIGSRRINTFTPKVVEKFIQDLEREEGVTDSILSRSFTTLRSVLKSAENQGATAGNPLKGVVAPEYKPPRVIIPTREERKRAIAEAGDALALIIEVMSGCGLRTSEACAVNINNIVADDVYRVTEQIDNKKRVPAPLKHRDEGDFREVPLPATVKAAILAYAEKHGTDEKGYLIRTNRGNYMGSDTLSHQWLKLKKKANLPENLRLYSMRHFFASNCLTKHIPITDVAEWMGHKSIEVTFKVYRHLMPGSVSSAAKLLDMELAA
ncbi:tyrosine-type recombinase/integrase [Streptomyces sp. NBRC 110611]|uniref:tyrosine-type recombinase/integrase n=1 Tax=Streptomyces sp. NBRC 110611 TaxID=1621259 RepID=UPI000834658D|nr:site-specific integrase [Streptomyces sp. NBRC 110611]